MDKNIIKKHLNNKFLTEAKEEEQTNTPGISVTNAAKKQSEKENKQGVKDMDKELADYQKSLEKGMETTKTPNKFNYANESEVEYHNQMEIRNGQEMIQYDRDPIQEFKDRAKEALEGSSRMGNNPEWANVIPAQKGFTGPDFGKNLVKDAEASFQKRMAAEKGNYSFGGDIENENRAGLKMTRFSALAENNVNNKPQIKETMKRLKFKNEFKGVGNALKMIPESYKVDNKVFEMTDGVENYKIRWEGSLTEGKAVVLMASDKNLVNEDMQKMKRLMGYKSQETLGNVKGKARLDENAKFTDIWKKTRTLMEMEDIEDADAKEGNWDEINVPQATDAKKHIEGSVSTEKGTKAPKPKSGNWDEVKKKAAEATKHVTMKESVEEEGVVKEEEVEEKDMPEAPSHEETDANQVTEGDNIEGTTAEENYWEKKKVPQAAEAKKHVHMGKESKVKLETEGKEEELSEGVVLGGIKFEPIVIESKKKNKKINEGLDTFAKNEIGSIKQNIETISNLVVNQIGEWMNKPMHNEYMLLQRNVGQLQNQLDDLIDFMKFSPVNEVVGNENLNTGDDIMNYNSEEGGKFDDFDDTDDFQDGEEFVVHGTYTLGNSGGYEIMLSDSGDMAKVRDAYGSDNPKTSDWLPIEYVDDYSVDNEDGEWVIDPNGYDIPLNMVMRVR